MTDTRTDTRVSLDEDFIRALRDTGADILTSPSDCWPYGGDNSCLHHPPDAVALVHKNEEVAAIVKLCAKQLVPVTARGLSSGTTGAAVPVRGGLVVSFERMNKILGIDPANRTLRAQVGVSNQAIQDYCKDYGFFWAPDPGSAEHCTLGGNLACNAAGPRAVKYGTARENTLGLKAVTGIGDEIITGVQTSKGVVGLDLTRLLIGSEGTLAIITEAILKLTPLPELCKTMSIFYSTAAAAAEAVGKIMTQAFTPCALELMDSTSLNLVREYGDVTVPENAAAMLLVRVDGSKQTIGACEEAIRSSANHTDMLVCRTANSDDEAEQLTAARKALSPTLRRVASGKINEDVVVPVSKLAVFIHKLEALSKTHKLTIASFGHAGNGNLHVNILFDKSDARQTTGAERCLSEVFNAVLGLGGTLSGEHGIGLVKHEFVKREIPANTLQVMRYIKQVFDPKMILNPGKSGF